MTRYIWDVVSDNVLMEVDDNGNTIASYEHEPGLHGELISQRRNGYTYYYHYDGLGNTVAVTDENENVVETATYSAFGEVVAKTSSIVNPFGYKGALGYYANPVTNDLDVRARIYKPGTGRWLSVDPIGFLSGDANLYRYVMNSPINFVDPSGRLTVTASGTYCPGCGNVGMSWNIKSADLGKEGLVVQKICFEINIVTCERVNDCCKGTKRHYCKECFYEELIHFSDKLAATDEWRLPRILPDTTKCGQRGDATITSQIRGFPFRDIGYPKVNWIAGKGEVTCGEFKIGASNYSLQEPNWWGQHSVEITSDMIARWKCCQGDSLESYMAYSGSTGSHGSDPCEDQIDPRQEQR